MGLPSMMKHEYEHKDRTVRELQQAWLEHLEKRSKSLRVALKSAFNDADAVDWAAFQRAIGVQFVPHEAARLFESWAVNGKVVRSTVQDDLAGLDGRDTALFAMANRGGSLDPKIIPGSKSRSNQESTDSGLVRTVDPDAVPYQPASISHRAITAAPGKPRPPLTNVAAGVSQVTGGTINNGSSVPGGIFSSEFLDAAPAEGNGGNKSNLASVEGGIFEDHSDDPVLASGGTSRSQRSSVPGGIFAPAPRPDTVEYGYERFPRQGLMM